MPSGPAVGGKDSTYEFTTIATDPDGDGVSYRFDWGNGDTSEWSAWVPSGQGTAASRAWHRAGTYSVKAQAKDADEGFSAWSSGHQTLIRRNPWAPGAPTILSGPYEALVGELCSFSTTASDPDLDSIAVRFDWGDGDTSDWSEVIASSGSVAVEHTWSAVGAFTVRAQAMDEDSLVSVWSGGLAIQTFGRTTDVGYDVVQTPDGGFAIAGRTESYGAGSSDVWLIKTDGDGNMTWNRPFGDTRYDDGRSLQLASDGGYVIVGTTQSYGAGSSDVWLIKTDAAGNKTWDRTFGGGNWEEGRSVQQTVDGGYVIVGTTQSYGAGSSDVWLIKTDAAGNKIWDRTFGGSSWEEGCSVQQTVDGGYVIVGNTWSYGAGSSDVWLVKTDAGGNKTWDRTYGGTGWDWGNSVQRTADGGLVIAGGTERGGEMDAWFFKTDESGNVAWCNAFYEGGWDGAYSVRQTAGHGYVAVGSLSAGRGTDAWWVTADSLGNGAWWPTQHYEDGDDVAYAVQPTTDGGSIIAGQIGSLYGSGGDVLLLKIDASGNEMWVREFGNAYPRTSTSPLRNTSDGRGGDNYHLRPKGRTR